MFFTKNAYLSKCVIISRKTGLFLLDTVENGKVYQNAWYSKDIFTGIPDKNKMKLIFLTISEILNFHFIPSMPVGPGQNSILLRILDWNFDRNSCKYFWKLLKQLENTEYQSYRSTAFNPMGTVPMALDYFCWVYILCG